ncbi:hypothetical protein BY996DRAFT_6533065 [Phakopsora pachyrhizi]|nr:hypothetical protein BY996DRAFT_6533065 [Phakopsora pachyrhizi]
MPVRDRRGKLPKAERLGLGRLERQCRYRRADDILQDQRRKALCGVGRRRRNRQLQGRQSNGRGVGGYKRGDKKGEKEKRKKGRRKEVSVGLVRRRPKGRTDIWGISKAVVGRAVGQDCRRARRRHTEVRSSYHFRVRTEVNFTPAHQLLLPTHLLRYTRHTLVNQMAAYFGAHPARSSYKRATCIELIEAFRAHMDEMAAAGLDHFP